MNTLGSLEINRRVISGPIGVWDLDISDMDFASADDYEAIILCGNANVDCNNTSTSPPVNVKTATSVRIITRSTTVVVGIFPLIGKTKRAV